MSASRPHRHWFALLAGLLAACGEPLPELDVDEVVYLDQGWTPEERLVFYYTAQGTQLHGLRYQWFINLNRPFSDQRLADPDYLSKLGFLVDPCQESCEANPGNLPVGFTFHRDQDTGEALLDITCAACHTGEIQVNGKGIRVDGGQAMHAFTTTSPGQFGVSLLAAMMATYANPFEFDRFAQRVLSSRYPDGKAELRQAFAKTLGGFTNEATWGLVKGLYPTEEGYGRTDALGRIGNTVFGEELDRRNLRIANAPVSYPHLWDIWKFDWVQWNGSAAQPMARNVGEALGVKAKLGMVDADGNRLAPEDIYRSSVLIRELHCLETLLQRLRPPVWEESLLGEIALDKAAHGRRLFRAHCKGCHGPHVYSEDQQPSPLKPVEWQMKLVPVEEIGTDPHAANNFLDNRFDAQMLDPGNPTLADVAAGPGLEFVTGEVIKRKYDELGLTEAEQETFNGFGRDIAAQELRCYKARPLHGIWATPPFLHNGSVRTVYQLLSPEEERDQQFVIGTRAYDTRNLGYETFEDKGGVLFDTSLPGNANTGHQFRNDGGAGVIGRGLTEDERYAIIEYLKVMGHPVYDPDYRIDHPDYDLALSCQGRLQGPTQLLEPCDDPYECDKRRFCAAGLRQCREGESCPDYCSS